MLVHRRAWEKVGLFDERYFMYFEDADLCRRVRDAGFAIMVVPRAKLWHKVSLSAQRDKPQNRYYRFLNQVRFYREHPHSAFVLLQIAYIVAQGLKTVVRDILSGDWSVIGPTWRGIIDGYRPAVK